MSELLGNEIKGLIDEQIGQMKISDYKIGKVTRIEDDTPIVQLDSSQGELPKASIAVPDYLKEYEVKIKKGELEANIEGPDLSGRIKLTEIEGKLTIDNRLKEGDRIYLLGKTGGQKFLILGRIPE